ncbi:hypothetical protein G9464_20855 [Halostella sp. JP-L12]|uniref:hypothetical protein n=1 Tax=Halostella TaxID=1843185 RepID=UPI000EF7EC23|nr:MULTISPECIES: hypothetical protein [Halostella]NHN50022.1 hypothetical protein [Halostella sp. JP-L12]
MEINGLDELQDDLEELQDAAEDLDGEHELTLEELFTPDFMQRHTDFGTIEEFFESSPWTIDSEEDLEAIPDDEFNDYVDEHTDFNNGEEMQSQAGEEWAADKLGF